MSEHPEIEARCNGMVGKFSAYIVRDEQQYFLFEMSIGTTYRCFNCFTIMIALGFNFFFFFFPKDEERFGGKTVVRFRPDVPGAMERFYPVVRSSL
jgi:hypothetical protein